MEVDFGGGRGGKDTPEQVKLEGEIRALAKGCRVARFGGGGWPQWLIKVVEPDGLHSTPAVQYNPVRRDVIELLDDRGLPVAESLKRLLERSNVANVKIVRAPTTT